jgi:hypothetical protein
VVESVQNLHSALQFLAWGWSVIPLCWPNDQGRCGCGRNHAGAGKAPLTTRGVNDSSDQFHIIMDWWKKWPLANIGIDLGKSGLFVIGPDSVEWEDRFQRQGLPKTLTAKSGGGDGHYHYYYRRPENVLQTRLNRSHEYDIQTQGYMVAPPSLHQSGNNYTWLDPEMAERRIQGTQSLPEPPQWAITLLEERGAEPKDKPRRQEPTWDALPPPPVINATTLDPASLKWWTGEATKMAGKNVDRSTTLFRLGAILAKRGYDEPTIVAALHERDIALGYNKFSRRADGGMRGYTDIATKVLIDERGRGNNRPRPPGPPPPDQYDDEGNPIDPKDGLPPTGPADDIGISRVAEYFQHVTRARNWQGDNMRRKLFIATRENPPIKAFASHVLFENPHLYPSQPDHVSWLKYADGEWAKENPFMGQGLRINPKVTLAERCLKPGWKWCDVHGKAWKSRGYCGLKSCPSCASKVARDMAKVTLPYRGEMDGRYRQVWFSIPVELPEESQDWEDVIYRQARRMVALCGHKLQEKLKRRRGCLSRIYHRATSFHLAHPVSTIHQKMVFFEAVEGELDDVIKRLAEDLGGEIAYDVSTTNGETAVLQMIADSVATLASLDPDDELGAEAQHDLFAAYWAGTKGIRLIRPMDIVTKKVEELVGPEEPDVCPVVGCGLKLKWVSEEQVLTIIIPEPVTVGPPGPGDGGWEIPRLL